MYTDDVIGWSIRHPSDWEIFSEEPGRRVTFVTPDLGVLSVSTVLLLTSPDESSSGYLTVEVESWVAAEQVREPQEDDWFWLDSDFDGVEGPQDVAGVELNLAVDPRTGETIPEGVPAPMWWYGYFDPQALDTYAYSMQTYGVSSQIFENVDDVVASFEPPDGYPSLQPPAG